MPDQQKHTHAPQLSRTTIVPTAQPIPPSLPGSCRSAKLVELHAEEPAPGHHRHHEGGAGSTPAGMNQELHQKPRQPHGWASEMITDQNQRQGKDPEWGN